MAQKATDQQILTEHSSGASLGEIAQRLGVSKTTIHRRCKTLGLSFSTAQTAAATQSHKDRAAAMRAALEIRLLEEAVVDLDAKTKTYPDEVTDPLSQAWITIQRTPGPRERKDLTGSATMALTGALKIAGLDAGEDALALAASKVDDLIAGIRAAP